MKIKGRLRDEKILLLAVLAFIAILVIKKFDLSKEIQSFVGLIALFMGYAGNMIEKKGKTKVDEMKDYLDNKHHISPYIATLYIVGFMQLSQRVVWLFIIFVLNIFEKGNVYTSYDLNNLSAIVGLSGCLLIVPLALYITHRMKKNVFLWIFIGLLINQLISILIAVVFYKTLVFGQLLSGEFFLNNIIINILVLVPGTILGYFWANNTQLTFVMNQLFQRLPREEQKQLLELTRSLPTVTDKKNVQE
jgi:hypothetical protein